MLDPRPSSREVDRFVLRSVENHPRTLVSHVADHFAVSRQAAYRYVKRLVDRGLLEATGERRKRTYRLRALVEERLEFPITSSTEDHIAWMGQLRPLLLEVPDNVLGICDYGVTEMVNNAIDHSGSPTVVLTLRHTPIDIDVTVEDKGIGIFRKIKQALGLEDERHAILELAKGKLTTDPTRHTGQGIFFTSRMFDYFCIMSGHLFFVHDSEDDDWLIETRVKPANGTCVRLRIATDSDRATKQVFDRYSGSDDYGFDRTHVPLRLANLGRDQLVSRSQAKRVLARFDRFKEVFLDFDGVEMIGQAFADEIFRVFRKTHPDIRVEWIRATLPVTQMIRRALAEAGDTQQPLFPMAEDAASS